MYDDRRPASSNAGIVALALSGSRLAPPSLPDEDRSALERAALPAQTFRAGTDLIRENDAVDRLHVVTEGWGCRFQTTRGGGRQIVALVIPGDVANLASLMPGSCDFGVRLLTPAKVVSVPVCRLNALAHQHRAIGALLLRLALRENASLSRWNLCLGRKSAEQRLAHLFCELGLRLAGDGTGRVTFDMPLTQEQIADTIGLTSVHVNRTMQRLRAEGLVVTTGRSATIPDVPRLRSLAEFNPAPLCS